MPELNTPIVSDPDTDLWIDQEFGGLDLREGGQHFADHVRQTVATEPAAEPPAEPAAEPSPQSGQPTETAATEGEEPIVHEYPDGSSVTIEKVPTGLKATLSMGTGSGDEVFYGRDQSELLDQVLVGKLNATKKIKEQAKQLRLTVPRSTKPVREAQPAPAQRELSADDKFAFKTMLESDPSKAFDELIEKKTGMKLADLVESAKRGDEAAAALYIDTESRAFLAEHPQYISTNENLMLVVGYLAKSKLNTELTDRNYDQVMYYLSQRGLYNRTTLAEAYDALSQDGLLELSAPEEEEPAPPEPPPAPPATPRPAPAPTGIQGQRRPRAASIALGLRPGDTNGADATPTTKAPSVEELDSLSTEEINKLFAGVVRARALTRR